MYADVKGYEAKGSGQRRAKLFECSPAGLDCERFWPEDIRKHRPRRHLFHNGVADQLQAPTADRIMMQTAALVLGIVWGVVFGSQKQF